MNDNCLFCKIAAGKIPSTTLYENDEVIAFEDIAPQAPVHVLIIPKRHIEDAQALQRSDDQLLGQLFETARSLAVKLGIESSGYRLVSNIGRDGCQSVPHLHLHLLGGRSMTWPPG